MFKHVQGKDLDCVKVLLVFGANVNSLNAKGQTPTDIAVDPECYAAVCGLCVSRVHPLSICHISLNHCHRMTVCIGLSEVWELSVKFVVVSFCNTSQEIVEFLQIRGGYIGEFGKQRSLDITKLPKHPSNDPLESMPVKLINLTG